MASLTESQKERADSGVEPGFGRMGVLTTGNGGAGGTMESGVESRRGSSVVCEGMVATGGRVGCGAGFGALDAVVAVTIACNWSILFSISATLAVGCTGALGFAGLRRATCSIHSTRAFWHLWQMAAVSEGTHLTLCFRQRSQAKAFPILPSLASIVMMEWEGVESLTAEWWGSPIMPRRNQSVKGDA